MIDPDVLHGIDFGDVTMDDEWQYCLGYDVEATTSLEAVERAAAMLRTGVNLIGLVKAEQTTPGHWHVTLKVWEAMG